MVKEEKNEDFWLRLDNAAKIYPAIQDEELTSVFRISAVLKQRVKVKPLLKAIGLLEHRFPYYKVRPKYGFFWHYLEHFNQPIPVEADVGIHCRAFARDNLLFRVLARDFRISVEFSHILTDGSGGFEFLKSLLVTYFQLTGTAVPGNLRFLRPDQTPSEKEYEDSYSKFFKKKIPIPKKIPRAFHLPFKLKSKPRFDAVTAIVPLEIISKRSKEYGVSITVYLTAVYLVALQTIFHAMPYRKKKRATKIIRIEVPVNLRKVFPSETMRNFSLFALPEIDLQLGDYTFEETLKTVHHLMALNTDEKLISKIISRNVGAERNIFIKNIPLFIKSIILYYKYKSAGTHLYSGVISNLGKIDLTPELNNEVDHFRFIPPPPDKILKVNCGVAGFGNKLVLSIGNITTSKEFEQRFFRILINQGIPVMVLPG